MKYKGLVIILLWHALFFVGATALFLLMFRSSLFSNTIFFFRGIILIFLAGLMSSIIFYFVSTSKYRGGLTFRDLIISFLIIVSFNITFFTHVPVTADRSVSIYILGYMNTDSEKLYTKDQLSEVLVDKYIYENDGIEKRIHEQIVFGNLDEIDGKVILTDQGISMIKLYIFVADVFGFKNENLSL